ncbi:MAG: hypothetical protein WAU70_15460 [Flavobacteriales bacterium]
MPGPRFLAAPFRTDQPLVLLLLLPVMVLLWWGQVAVPTPAGATVGMPLFSMITTATAPWPWLQGLLGLAALGWLAPLLASTANNAELFDRRNRLPAILLLLLMGLVGGQLLSPALCGMLPLLLALRRAFALQGRSTVNGTLFNSGVLIGMAALFYLPYAFMVVAVWAAVSVMRPFDWREYAMPLAGAALAFYFCWGVMRLLGLSATHPIASITEAVHQGLPTGKSLAVMLMVLVPFMALGVLAYARSYQGSVMRERNSRSAFLALCWSLLAVIALELIVHRTFPVVLIAVPLAVLFAYPVLVTRRMWLAELAFLALLVIGCTVQWG